MANTFRWSDELYHHGILGQKWGIRRYQNPDGSLTEAGRRRYTTKNGTYEFNRIAYDYTHKRYSPKGKTAYNLMKNELKNSSKYNKVREDLIEERTKNKKTKEFYKNKEARANAREIDSFLRKLLNVEYNYESMNNPTTIMAHEFVNEIWRDAGKEVKRREKEARKNDSSEKT